MIEFIYSKEEFRFTFRFGFPKIHVQFRTSCNNSKRKFSFCFIRQ